MLKFVKLFFGFENFIFKAHNENEWGIEVVDEG
mgnify:CR=1 FL=1|jgi:hypothetical protein